MSGPARGRRGRLLRQAAALFCVGFALAGCLRREAGGSGAATLSVQAPGQADIASAPLSPEAQRRRLTLPPHLRDAAQNAQPLAAQAAAPAAVGAATQATGSLAGPPSGQASGRGSAPARAFRLPDAVTSALMTYPEIRVYEARLREAKAGIGVARSALWPSADLRLAIGGNFSGNYEGQTIPYTKAFNASDGRGDGGVILRQLVFDFGAAFSDVRRAELMRDSEMMRLRDKVEDIAGKTVQAYLKVLEQRALVALVDEVIGAHEELARIVQAHAREGHGTIADVERVNARIVDVRAIRSDVTLELKAAEDQFERLTRHRPAGLAPPPDMLTRIPRSPAQAVQEMLANNPRLAALASSTSASRAELDFQRASALPRFNLEVEGETKNFRNGPSGRTQAEARGMLAMRYRFMDGGLSSATREQTLARIEGGEFSLLNEREQLEQNIRQAYRSIDSSRSKLRLVQSGVSSARKVRELYLEQFKGGKRTVFELLDSQMSLFTVRRNQIESQFESRRAAYEIFRATGTLTQILASGT